MKEIVYRTIFKPLQVGTLPFHLPSTHVICLEPYNLNPVSHENETNAPCLVSLLCIFPLLGIRRGWQGSGQNGKFEKVLKMIFILMLGGVNRPAVNAVQ